MRIAWLALLTLGCTGTGPASDDTDPPDPYADLDLPVLGQPAALPTSGWTRVEGVVEYAEVSVREERMPGPQLLGEPTWEVTRDRLCESTDDAYREATIADQRVDPGMCDGPAFCAWAGDRLEDPATPGALRDLLLRRLPACQDQRSLRIIQQTRAVDLIAEVTSWDTTGEAPITPEILTELLDDLEAGELVDLPAYLRARRGLVEHADALRTVLDDRRRQAVGMEHRDAIGRALGAFEGEATVWRNSCPDAETTGCETVYLAPLQADADPGKALHDQAAQGTGGLRAWVNASLAAGLTREELVGAFRGCLEQATWNAGAHQACVELFSEYDVDALIAAAPRLLERELILHPAARRNLALGARGRGKAQLDALVEVGLLPADHGLPPPRDFTGAEELMVRAGVAVWTFSVTGDSLTPDAAIHRYAHLAGVGPVRVHVTPRDDAYRVMVWCGGERFDAVLRDEPADQRPMAREIAALMNTIAEHRGHSRRLLVQPGGSRWTDLAVVVGEPEALEAGVRAGYLSAPVPDAREWTREVSVQTAVYDPTVVDTGTW